MHKYLRLCFLQAILISIVSFSFVSIAAEQGGIRIRGPKASDAFPYDRYGPLTNKDTLWNIALKVRPDPRLTVYQVMTALYQTNPQAFKENNLNHLVSGEYLQIPDIEIMRAVNPDRAKSKSESDDTVWEKKVKKTLAANKNQQKPEEKAVQRKDLDKATLEINKQLKSIDETQEKRLFTIQQDVADSIDGLQALLQENDGLKKRLTDFNDQLTVMQDEVAKGQEIKEQMNNLLVNQQELLEKANAREQELLLAKQQAELERQSFANSPWMTGLLATIPALFLIAVIVFFLMRKKSPQEAVQKVDKVKEVESKAEESLEIDSPVAAPQEDKLDIDDTSLDDELSLDELSLDDELSIDLVDDMDDLDDDLGDLDDDLGNLDDDLSDLDDDLIDNDVIQLDDDDEDDSDSLDDLEEIDLDVDASVDEESDELGSNELDQGDLDALLSGLDEDEPEADSAESNVSAEEEVEELDGDELNQDDLDALLSGESDALAEQSEESEASDIDDELPDPADEIETQESASQDDIDAIMSGEDLLIDENEEVTELPDSEDDSQTELSDPDDIDALLEGIDAEPAEEATASEPESAQESEPEQEEDDSQTELSDSDDIDALLEGIDAEPAEESPASEPESAQESEPEQEEDDSQTELSDPDDIDALLEGIDAEPAEEAAASEPESAQESEPKQEEDESQTELSDPDDIDALLAGIDAEPAEQATASEPESAEESEPAPEEDDSQTELSDPDDIDALLEGIDAEPAEEATVREPESAQEPEEDDSQTELSDPDDIDALLEGVSGDSSTDVADSLPDESVELTDPDDIDALLADIDADSTQETNQATGDEQTELSDPDDIDALIADIGGVQEAEIASSDVENIDALLNGGSDNAAVDNIESNDVGNEKNSDKKAGKYTEEINNLSEDVIAPFLTMDLSDISVSQDNDKDDIEAAESDLVESSDAISDDIDIDALLDEIGDSDSQTEINEESISIGDELADDIEESDADEHVSSDDFDDALLSEEFTEEKLRELADDQPPVELSPDFTDSNVLADLLNDDGSEPSAPKVVEASELDDIQELDDLDFDELLANIEEESAKPSSDLIDELDIGDDIDDAAELEELIEAQNEKAEDKNEDDFISVDSLLSDSLDINMVEEPYEQEKIDVGLSDFPEFGHNGDPIDVDEEDENGIAAKLDLAKVYLEIGDIENAEVILLDIVDNGDAQQQFEAQQLLDNLK